MNMTHVSFSRYISKDILTIREAVWLTDNTYKYEDLVRMMGEVISVLEGKIRVSRVYTHLMSTCLVCPDDGTCVCFISLG